MATPTRPSQRVRFGEFELDLSTRELWADGTKESLAPQPFQVLQLLIENRSQLVTRQALIKRLWPSDTFVDYEQGLKQAVNRLREALNDSAEKPRFIETLPRQGYRFISELEFESAPETPVSKPFVLHPHLVEIEVTAEATKLKRFPVSLVIGAFLLVVVSVGGVLFWRSRVSRREVSFPEPKLTQLTANSFENPVTSSEISPDGKYLAFTDNARRMRVRLLATGETQTIPEPESLESHPVDWGIVAWLPDGTRFIANARPRGSVPWGPYPFRYGGSFTALVWGKTQLGEAESIWIVSVLGKVPQKLRDDAHAFSVSPDGSLIAFGTNATQVGDREIWLMDDRGLQARKLYDASEKMAIGNLHWSADGQRVIYFEISAQPDPATGRRDGKLVNRDLRGGPAVPLVQSSDCWKLTDFVSLPAGRVIYVSDGNFWELRIDSRNGKPIDTPRQLTNWSGLWLGYTSLRSDGKRLAFLRSAPQRTVNVADIEADGARLSNARHFTLNEYSNTPQTWTPDSRALVFNSWRDGHGKLFMQALDSDTEEPLVNGAENVCCAAISPDGAWLFYLDCVGDCNATNPVMAVPLHGGAQHLVMKSDTYGRPRCAVAPASLCLVAEQSAQGKPIIFTAFDALKGRGPEVARFETDPTVTQYSWGISPDGSNVALLNHFNDKISIVSLKGEPPKEIPVKNWTNLHGLYWAADGKGWFTVSGNETGSVLLHVDLQGEAHPIWRRSGEGIDYGLPSPDGRHLAIVTTTRTSNVWLMENF